jgi:hypothetical protein
MTDPYTGLEIPKHVPKNIEWRRSLLRAAKNSFSTRRRIKLACRQSPIYWLNLMGWTFLQKSVDGSGHETSVTGGSSHVPFVTWKIQDDALVKMHEAIKTGHDVLISKSRDMGASWLIVALFQWYWQFVPSTTFLELSRKESLVDRRGDMDSLFEKHRYLLRWQPEWMRPKQIVDTKLHLENQDLGTSIEGESTNENAGQASRKTAILLDEFARVATGEEIDLATADTSSCRIFNSTPSGPNTQFTRIFKAVKSGVRDAVLVEFPWWHHPLKGRDATQVYDPVRDCLRWTSPYYEDQKTRRSKKNIAQNLDMEHGRAGDAFFDAEEVEQHRKKFETPPLAVGNIAFDSDLPQEEKFSFIRQMQSKVVAWAENPARRPWRFWVPLIPDEKTGQSRPHQLTRYVFGIDISAGSGSSNSVITVLDNSTNLIVAKFWDAYTSPEELAEVAAFAGVWFGGIAAPLIIFEKNGPGVIFGRKLLSLGYPSIYYQKTDSTRTDTPTGRWGWQSSPSRKEMLLGMYRDALKLCTIMNPCKESLDEALDYVYSEKGKIEPGTVGSEEGGGAALHGDHVISDALVVLGRKDLPTTEIVRPNRPPVNSFADRRRTHQEKRSEKWAWSR